MAIRVIQWPTGRQAYPEEVASLSRERGWDLNHTHFHEKLKEEDGVVLGRETIPKDPAGGGRTQGEVAR